RVVRADGAAEGEVVKREKAEVEGARGLLEHQPVAMQATQDCDRLAHDPSVDCRHEAVALRSRQKGASGLHTATLVAQAQQNLAPWTRRMFRRQGHGRLSVELKVTLVHRPAEAHDPSALRLLPDTGGRLWQGEMDAVASRALGGVARGGGGAQDAGRASARRGDRDEADADAQGEAFLLPHVAEVF